MLIFAYGTLKRGYALSDRLLKGEGEFNFLGEYVTDKEFGIFDFGDYPLLCPQAPEPYIFQVKGEIWEVDETAAAQIASIESGAGYYPINIWADRVNIDFMWEFAICWAHSVPEGDNWLNPNDVGCIEWTGGKK